MVMTDPEQFTGTERFLIQRQLGAGGMGVVYLALDRDSGQQVALKTLKQVDPTAIFQFKQEFRSLAELVHPHLIRMHELICENDQWFFVMELVEGAVDFHEHLLGLSAAPDPSHTEGAPSQPGQAPSVSVSRLQDSSVSNEATASWIAGDTAQRLEPVVAGEPTRTPTTPGPTPTSLPEDPYTPTLIGLPEAESIHETTVVGLPGREPAGDAPPLTQFEDPITQTVIGRVPDEVFDRTVVGISDPDSVERSATAPKSQIAEGAGSEPPRIRMSDPVRNYARLREAFRQLVSGVRGLHRAGMLHRDLKPANALVSNSGNVVLLDFGLIAELSAKRVEGIRNEIAGTVAYMSPEQAQGLPLTEATDWYAVGVMLFQALAGRRPFTGKPLELLQRKIHEDAPDPSFFADGIPADLKALCVRLLKRVPEERPSGEEVAAFFGGDDEEEQSLPPGQSMLFVGRERQLAELEDSFQQVQTGRTVVTRVHGRSGAGKSTLIQHFLDDLAGRHQAVVLTGRCYEQESVPFKGVDSLIDAVTQFLRANPQSLESLPPTHITALARIFPVLNRISSIKSLSKKQIVTSDLQELRRQAFDAFRQLLLNIGSDRPLVVYLDDLQWGDLDSAALLSHLLSGDQSPRMLLLVAYRSEYADSSVCLQELLATETRPRVQAQPTATKPTAVPIDGEDSSRGGMDASRNPARPVVQNPGGALESTTLWKELRIDPLTSSETRQLARSLLRDDVPRVEEMADQIVTQSGGSAYFVMELARHVNSGQDLATVAGGGLDDVLWRHITHLSDEAQKLMHVIAVSGQPIPLKNVLEAAQLPGVSPRVLAKLRTERFVRSSGPGMQAEIEAYHDRIRESVVNHLDAPTRQAHHSQLANSLERSGEANPETIAGHLEGSLQLEKAGRFYSAAAKLALEKLAFDRAEEFSKHAVRLAVSDEDKVNAHERLVHYFTDMARFPEAYAQGRAGAKEFGVSLPAGFVPPLFIVDFVKAKWGLWGKPTADLVNLPTMQDARLEKAVRIINACAKAAYQVRPELCVAVSTKVVNFCLKSGNTPDCAIGWMVFGSIFQGGVLGNHPVGYDYGRLALSIVDKFQQEKQRPEVTFVVGYFGTSWMRPATEAEELWRTTYDSGLATGDLFHTGCACAATIQSLFMRGVSLTEIWAESDRFMEFLKPLNLREPIGAIRSVRQAIRNLRGRTLNKSTFSTETFHEDEYVAGLPQYGSRHFAHFYYVNKMLTQYLWKEYDAALATSQISAKYLKESPGMLHAAEHYFLTGLIQAAQAERSTGWNRFGHLRGLRAAAKRFAGWARRCPQNFEHKSLLLTGELARLNGDSAAAVLAYNAAIRSAGEHGYRQVKAIAHQVASRLHARMGVSEQDHYHRTLSEKCFQDWGASAQISP
jgi:serine/threonine protein kinase